MILIFGGAYQGKKEIAIEQFKKSKAASQCAELAGDDRASIEVAPVICDCSKGQEPDFDADIIYGLEGFAFECVKKQMEAKEFMATNAEKWRDKILVVTDVSQGVVPIDRDVRAFREMNGRMMIYLAEVADMVIRVFCGIGKDIK
ncbi:MAG: bifunctional adenosylcobinamide kinase/adenosylcobinamide-phosphate guanylyltransferase [Bacillota bacterium]|nr:bifunctional adenosylcobinamide kinase/adenosylcobinamide-phosphate guanylyltransferase [Bacillota bacterium]